MTHRVALTLKEEKGGALRYPQIQAAVLLQESHFLAGAGPQRLIPQTILHGPTSRRYTGLDRVLSDFVEAWSHFNRMPYSEQTVSSMPSGYVPTSVRPGNP